MIKKIILPLVLVAGFVTTAAAHEAGFSLGVDLEGVNINDKRSVYTAAGAINRKDTLGGRGAGIGLNLGYRQCFDRTFAGIEIGADISKVKSRAISSVNQLKYYPIQAKNSFFGKIKLGVKAFDASSLYLVGGYKNTKLTAQYVDGTTGLRQKKNKRKGGALFGAGIEMPLMSDNLAFNLEYTEMASTKLKVIRTDGLSEKHRVNLGNIVLGLKAYF